jgi:hypothetical protein
MASLSVMEKWIIKRCIPVVILLAAAACQPASSSSSPAPATSSEASPVYVPAMCTLLGGEVRTEAPAGHPVILMWGWSAATKEQVEAYVRASILVVTVEGVEISGTPQGNIPYDETARLYKAVWTANLGILKRSIYTTTYTLAFREKIFDGVNYYGPGTENEKLEDRCEIEIK